ncbi:MAG: hypothetical protein MUF39_03955 [Cyclobacteriaceae bacterium]|jgi:hypothetical protein|nr:hypothetical protein [Cyclobacteriaceae bacterium]
MAMDLLPDASTHSSIAETMRSIKSDRRKINECEWTQCAGTNLAEEIRIHPGNKVIAFKKTIPTLILTARYY